MSARPLLACTTSGGSSSVIASRRVACKSSKDRDTRSIVMLGYSSWKAALSASIWAS